MNTLVFVSLLCCALSALILAENGGSNPAQMPSAQSFENPGTKNPTPVQPKNHTTAAPPKNHTTAATPKNYTTAAPPKNHTTAAPPKNHTTAAPPKKPTTAVPPKNHTTAAPPKKPTTAAPPKNHTTASPPKNHTTAAPPKNHTTAAPPKPAPTPTPKLAIGNYTLLSKDKKSLCLMAQMELQIRLVSTKANGTYIVQPNMTRTEGFCQETKANLTLVLKEGFITFLFNKSVANNTVNVHSVEFKIRYPLDKANPTNSAKNTTLHMFSSKIGNSYSCREESVFIGNNFYLDVSKDRVQAFNFSKSNEFGIPDYCPADQPDYRIPVAVGLTLLVLILIVLVAYLLSRRRRADGYQTL